MFKKAFFILLLAVIVSPLSALDTVEQSVGLSLDKKSPNYNIDLMLKKVILSVASSNQNVRIFSSDKSDIEYTGVQSVNAEVLMKSVKKGGAFQVELYETGESLKKPVLFDDTIRLSLRGFGDTVDDFAVQIAKSIARKFPPKPVAQLTKIDLVKIKLSEYESQDGNWTVSVVPAYNIVSVNTRLNGTNFINNDSVGKIFKNNGGSVKLEGIYQWRQWNFSLSVNASMGGWREGPFYASFTDYHFAGMASYGFFGSVIILGLQPAFSLFNYKTDYTNWITNTSGTTALVAPDIMIRNFQINIYIQINISKDYYITFSSGPPFPGDFFYGINVDFNKNGQHPEYLNENLPGDRIDGIPPIWLTLNFRLFSGFWLRIYYETAHFNFNIHQNNTDLKFPVSADSVIYLDRFTVDKTRIGLGFNYAF